MGAKSSNAQCIVSITPLALASPVEPVLCMIVVVYTIKDTVGDITRLFSLSRKRDILTRQIVRYGV